MSTFNNTQVVCAVLAVVIHLQHRNVSTRKFQAFLTLKVQLCSKLAQLQKSPYQTNSCQSLTGFLLLSAMK